MQLLLKHGLTRKSAEYKLLVMYYNACNVISKAKLMMSGIDDNDIRKPRPPKTPRDFRQASLWYEQIEKRASNL